MTAGDAVEHIRRALVGHGLALFLAMVVAAVTIVAVVALTRGRREEQIERAVEWIFPRVWYGLIALVLLAFGVLAYVNNR